MGGAYEPHRRQTLSVGIPKSNHFIYSYEQKLLNR